MLPDLPLHGDSEDRPRHPYSPDWMAEVIAGFCREVCGPRPLVGGHDVGAQILLRAVQTRQLTPGAARADAERAAPPPDAPPARADRARRGAAPAPCPGSTARSPTPRGSRSARRPASALTARGNPAARDLVRHAFADVGGNANRARAWARAARRWPTGAQSRPARRLPR